MCTLAAFVACHPEIPLVIGANRDEFFARPTTGPTWWAEPRRVVAGVDLQAGGTWLGANEHGVVAAVLNRRGALPPDRTRRSRGSLVVDVLMHETAAQAVTTATALPPDEFNLCTLLIADRRVAVLLANQSGAWRRRDLEPGLHVVTNRESDLLECPRHERTVKLLTPVVPLLRKRAMDQVLKEIQSALADHGGGSTAVGDPLSVPCVHTEAYGTRSSSVLVMEMVQVRFFHAAGPPCQNEFHELLPLPLRRRS